MLYDVFLIPAPGPFDTAAGAITVVPGIGTDIVTVAVWTYREMLVAAWAFGLSALIVSLVAPWNRRFAWRVGAVDRPDSRKVHRRATPRLGGLSAAVALLACVGLWLTIDPTAPEQCRRYWGLFLGIILMLLVGLHDDLFGLGPHPKLVLQVLAAGIIWYGGIRIDVIDLPLAGPFALAWADPLITILWIVGVTNAINFLDGLDGLAAGTAALASSSFVLIAGFTAIGSLLGLMSAALIGACIVLVVHNVRMPKSFLGDSGSLLLGSLVASMAILAARAADGNGARLLLPVIALVVPLVDMAACVARRTLVRRSVFAADRGHIHHMLLSFGFTPKAATAMLCGATGVFGLIAGLAARGPRWVECAVLLAIVALAAVVYRRFGYLSLPMWLHCRRANRILTTLADRCRNPRCPGPADSPPVLVERLRLVLNGIRRARRALGIEYVLLQRCDDFGTAAHEEQRDAVPILELGNHPGRVVTTRLYTTAQHGTEGLIVTLGEGPSRRPARIHAKELLMMPLLAELAAILGAWGPVRSANDIRVRERTANGLEAAVL